METRRPRLGGILIRKGIISPEELEAAVLYQLRAEAMVERATPEQPGAEATAPARGMRLGEALVSLGICTEKEVAEAVADQLEVPFLDLRETLPTLEAIQRVPLPLAQEYVVLPVRLDGEELLIASADPANSRIQEAIRQATGVPLVVVASASEAQIRELLRQCQAGVPPRAREEDETSDVDEVGSSRGSIQELLVEPEALSPIDVFNQCVSDLVRQGASDVFFGPANGGVTVQYRTANGPQTVATLPAGILPGLMTHVKLMHGMDLSGPARRQEGRSRVRVDGNPVRLHAATVLGPQGEGAVIRVLE